MECSTQSCQSCAESIIVRLYCDDIVVWQDSNAEVNTGGKLKGFSFTEYEWDKRVSKIQEGVHC